VARRGDDFARGYTPGLGDVVHLDRVPSEGQAATVPHYALVLSADLYNVRTGLVVLCPVTPKGGKLSDFELPVPVGRLSGAAILSELRSVDYHAHSIRFEGKLQDAEIAEANRRVRMIFP
jgi:mRNA interferase MazF